MGGQEDIPWRRSECPTRVWPSPKSLIITAVCSPVNAPFSLLVHATFCAQTEMSLRRVLSTVPVWSAGGQTTTSTPSGVAPSLSVFTSSATVSREPLLFQFPPMKILRMLRKGGWGLVGQGSKDFRDRRRRLPGHLRRTNRT